MKSLLLVCQASPWSATTAREGLDIALAGGAFDLPIGMLWRGAGVLQLRNGQHPQQIGQQDLQAQLSALPLFGVQELYACADSLVHYGCAQTELLAGVQLLDCQQQQELLARAQQVLVF